VGEHLKHGDVAPQHFRFEARNAVGARHAGQHRQQLRRQAMALKVFVHHEGDLSDACAIGRGMGDIAAAADDGFLSARAERDDQHDPFAKVGHAQAVEVSRSQFVLEREIAQVHRIGFELEECGGEPVTVGGTNGAQQSRPSVVKRERF